MHILFLTQILPYPPDAGPRIKTWHVIKYLAEKGHKITLVSFVRPDEVRHIPALEQVCDAVYTVNIGRSRLKDIYYLVRSFLSGRPFLIERDDLHEMRAQVEHLLAAGQYDCIHADQLTMTQFAFNAKILGERSVHKPILLFDAHNAVWRIVKQMGTNSSWIFKPFAAIESRRIKSYEGMIVSGFDHTTVVSDIDQHDLLQAVDVYRQKRGNSGKQNLSRITVIPITIDTERIQPINRVPANKNILTLGTLHYPPNADGIRWFAREVFPLIKQHVPDATLTIIGKNPPPDFLQMAENDPEEIFVTGYVPELEPYLQKAALVVVPVRAGSGMRVRILEAFAQAMPVITTTIGLEGICARNGEEVLVADTVEEFASATVRVLQDPELQNKLSEKGRNLAISVYDWRSALSKLDQIFK